MGGLRQGAAQGRRDARAPGRVRAASRRGRAVHRPGAGEDAAVPHRAAAQRRHGRELPVDRDRPPRWSTSTTSTASTTTSARSSSSSAPTSPTTPSSASTATSTPSARRPRPGSASTRWTTASPRSTTRAWPLQAICDGLTADTDRRAAAQVAAPAAPPLHPGGPGRRLPLRHLDPAGRVLPDPGARPAGLGPGLLRAGHPRQPRPRPSRPGQPRLQPPLTHAASNADPGPVPHPGDHRWRHPEPARRLQAHPIKQYHKEGRALRTETTINDTYDFDIGRRLNNLPALREIGFTANRRLLDVQRISHDPADGTTPSPPSTARSLTGHGHRVAGLRFADPRAQALLACSAALPAPAPRLHQPRPARAPVARCSASHPAVHPRPDDLRPATAPTPRPHRPHPAQPPLPGHRPPASHHAAVPHPRSRPAAPTGLAELTDPEPGPLASSEPASNAYDRPSTNSPEPGLAA